LADGDEAVADMLDWEHLSLINIDAGALYSRINDERGREEFRNSFIKSYSSSFKNSGGSPAVLSNWHEQSRSGSDTIVAADGPNGKVLLMTVAHIDGEQKVSKLELQ
jgi:glycosidase